MNIDITIVISVISVSFAVFFGLKNVKRNDTSDIERKAVETATINIKLDQIVGDCKDIKYDITATKKDLQELSGKVIAVEASCKSAHKRIDDMEG
jgi:peptidoglycan hydrolase CwlO-like protein